MKKTVAIPTPVRDARPTLAVLWCMQDDTSWSEYAITLPDIYKIHRYDIHQNIFPDSTEIERVYISGSELSVQDKDTLPIKAYLAAFFSNSDLQKHIAGTCFGAQALAKWALNKHVFLSFSPEEDLFRKISVRGREYTGHFNHAWFISADTATDWHIQSQKVFNLTDMFAKLQKHTCVDVFSAKIGQIKLFGTMAHPHIAPPEGQSIAPMIADFFR